MKHYVYEADQVNNSENPAEVSTCDDLSHAVSVYSALTQFYPESTFIITNHDPRPELTSTEIFGLK